MKFKVNFIRIVCLFLFYNVQFVSFSANFKENNFHKKEIQEIRDLIISNPDKARKRIDDRLIENQKTVYWLDYEILKIELYRFNGDFTHMKMELFKALRSVNSATKTENIFLLEYYKAMNYYINNQDEKLEASLCVVLQKSRKKGFKYIEGNCLSTFGRYYSEEGKYILGNKYLDSAAYVFEEIQDQNSLLVVNIRKGICEFWQGYPKKALTRFHKSLNFCLKNNLQVNHYYLLVNIAETHLYCKNSDSARFYYYEFLKFKKEADIRDVFQAYLGLEEMYKTKGNIDSAYYYSELKNEINDSIRNVLDKNLGEEIEKNYEKELNEKLIRKKDNVIRSIKENNKKILLIVIISTSFLLIIITIVYNAYNTKNRLNKVLIEQQSSIIEKNNVIDSALKEKVILLKEIHHRVKNNLQIISSLLNLQVRVIDDKNAVNALEEGKERIQAIALIHEKLYKDESFSSVDMGNYIEDLVEQLHKTYIPSDKEINYIIDVKNIHLNLDTSVPLGLIICELITNVFKHAFNNLQKGKLDIQIKKIEHSNIYTLRISDNGSGFNSKDKNFKDGIGLEIIEALTEQLEGEMETNTSMNGTIINITFKQL